MPNAKRKLKKFIKEVCIHKIQVFNLEKKFDRFSII